MKRRSFLQKTAMGGSGLIATAGKALSEPVPGFSYGRADSFRDILSADGQALIRIEIAAIEPVIPRDAVFSMEVEDGLLLRLAAGFMEYGVSASNPRFRTTVTETDVAVLTAWIGEPRETTWLKLMINGESIHFRLGELAGVHQIDERPGDLRVSVNYLLDRETGTINPADVGIDPPDGDFTVAILADTQGGDPAVPGSVATRMKIHNAFIEDSVNTVNQLDPPPAFTLVLGDVVDSQGEAPHFAVLHGFLKRLRSPVLYAIGNHESIYRARFSPGYYMEDFNNFFAAQKAMNGMELLLYSFNLGGWHFIVWPDPLRRNFWETHPHYFDWLIRDLDRNRGKPAVFMQHVPLQPIGLDPLLGYTESPTFKRRLLDILSRHGNVRFVFSGHVHIPLRASMKTAVSFRGMKLINLPAAGYRPRGFGEEELNGGPSQGVLALKFHGNEAKACYKTVTEEVYAYPDDLTEIKSEDYPLWLHEKWELPLNSNLVNGDFGRGLEGWARQYVYAEDRDPSNICKAVDHPEKDTAKALYLLSRKRGYDTPGQDRMPQSINHISQAIRINRIPGPLHFEYRIDGDNTDPESRAGAYVWLEGYRGRHKLLNLAYWNGLAYTGLGGPYGTRDAVPLRHFRLGGQEANRWYRASVDFASDFENDGLHFDSLQLDRLCVTLGLWQINDGGPQSYSIWFSGLSIGARGFDKDAGSYTLSVSYPCPDEMIWWMGKHEPFRHIAGEHRYIRATSGTLL